MRFKINHMKRIITALLSVIIAYSGVLAQEEGNVKAFQHLSVGLEIFSLTGFGVELAAPLNSHFALRGGISMFPFSFSSPIEVTVANGILNKMDNAIQQTPAIESELKSLNLPHIPRNISNEVDITATLGLINGKLLIDFYPSKKGSFHLTGGLYIGAEKLVKIEGKMQKAHDVLNVMKRNGYDFSDEIYIEDSKIYVKDIMNLDASIGINKVKPYIGLGFGRAVPKRRVGFSMDLGALYQSSPLLTSNTAGAQNLIDNNLGGITDLLKKITLYPVLSLKLNVKLF